MKQMNINETLFYEISKFSDNYGLHPNELKDFLFPAKSNDQFIERQDKAIELIKSIMTRHGKEVICTHIADLAKFERYIRESKPKHRDHVVHAMLSFILGIYINETYMKKLNAYVDPFQWKIACLFHDIGYLDNDLDSSLIFEKRINDIKNTIDSTDKTIPFKINSEITGELTNGENSFDLIQKCLKRGGIETDLKKEYINLCNNGKPHHGIISSLVVLSIIDLMYDKKNPNRNDYCESENGNIDFGQKYFINSIIPACSAIYIHSHKPEWFKNHSKINRSKASVAFLLKLSDCLQEWDRPSGKNIKGFSCDNFKIMFKGNNLIFKTNIDDDETYENIKKELSCLDCSDGTIEKSIF